MENREWLLDVFCSVSLEKGEMAKSTSESVQWISTKEAADFLGVSLSTFKRMCDSNDLTVTRTPGGHRRIDKEQIDQVKQRMSRHVGLFEMCNWSIDEIVSLLLKTDYLQLSERLFRSAPQLKNQVLLLENIFIPALWRIGDLWQKCQLTVAEEKICTSTANLALDALISRYTMPAMGAKIYVGASFVNSSDTLASKCIMLALMSIGIRPLYLGCNIAPEYIAEVATLHQAEAIWVSHTHVTDLPQVIRDHETLRNKLPQGARVIIGGGGLAPSTRRSLVGCIYYESLELMIEHESRITPR